MEAIRSTWRGSSCGTKEHDHFHFEDYANYTLQPVDAPVASERVGSKTTFCIIDTDRINHRLPGAPKRAVYTSCSDTVQGMSVGWGDTYKAGLAGQEIDVTDLPDGEYRLVIDADPMGKIIESNDNDNSSEVRILLSVQSGTLEVVEESDTGNDRPGNCPHC